jgi:hypothetical protein
MDQFLVWIPRSFKSTAGGREMKQRCFTGYAKRYEKMALDILLDDYSSHCIYPKLHCMITYFLSISSLCEF